MSQKSLMKKCPFREGTASRKLFAALARAGKKGLTARDAGRIAHVTAEKTQTLLSAFRNPYHCSGLTRNGLKVTVADGRFKLESSRADPTAHRPPPKAEQVVE